MISKMLKLFKMEQVIFIFALLLSFPIAVNAAVLFRSDFEAEDPVCWLLRDLDGYSPLGCNGWVDLGGKSVSLAVNEVNHSGTKSMKVIFSSNEQRGGAERPVVNASHIFVRFYDYYKENFDFAAGMKTSRIRSFNGNINNYDIVLYSSAQNSGGNYCGISDMTNLNIAYNGGPSDWGDLFTNPGMVRGRWYSVETEVKLNTPGLSDGEVRIYVNGVKTGEKKNINIRGNLQSTINRILIGGWYSNGAAGTNPCPNPESPSVRYIDDVIIADSYIGPIPTIVSNSNTSQKTISFVTPEPGTTQIEYGETTSYGQTSTLDTTLVSSHNQTINGLLSNKVYHFRVKSTWQSGYQYVSPDYTFDTFTSNPPPNPPTGLRVQ